MLDLALMSRIKLSPRPAAHRLVGGLFLAPNYKLPPRVRITFEGVQNLPKEPVVYAMNHTDRYNYWPFQYQLWRAHNRFTATWVKAKYYRNRFLATFMMLTNNIPTPSRGYLIVADAIATLGRRTTDAEYAFLRALIVTASRQDDDGERGTRGGGERLGPPEVPDAQGLDRQGMNRLLSEPRDILGLRFDPEMASWALTITQLLRKMQERFLALNGECFDKGLDLLVFPQGTRSVRLSRGHGGLAQTALHFGRTIVPVGCNGSDLVYPGGSPWAKGGTIVYRFGRPLLPDELAGLAPDEPFTPLRPEAEEAQRDRFQAIADLVMERINGLLDARHQFAEDRQSGGVAGSRRFL